MKIVALFSSNSSCGYHRIFLPFKYMIPQEGDRIILYETSRDIHADVISDADILIFNRICPYPIDVVKKWKKLFGFKIIADVDDSWELNVNHSLYKDWKKFETKKHIIESLELVDFVTVTNEALGDEVRGINKNVAIFPNALPFGKEQFILNPVRHNGFNIIYTGGQTHYNDLKTIAPTIKKLYHPDTNFIIAGFDKEDDFWIKIYNMVGKKAYFKNNLPLHEYMEHYSIADIVVAPLENNIFTRFKSNLKIIEAGCKQLPIVCSSVQPYLQDKTEGLFTCNNNREWYDTINKLRKDSSLRSESGIALKNYVTKNYNLFNINKERYDLFKSLI